MTVIGSVPRKRGFISPDIVLLSKLWKQIVGNNRKLFVLYALAFVVDGLLISLVATSVAPLADFFIDPSFVHASTITQKFISLLGAMNLAPTLGVLLTLFVLANLVKAISSIILFYYTRRFAYVLVHDLSTACLSYFLGSSLSFFLLYPLGTLQNTIQKESANLGDGIGAMVLIFAVLLQVATLGYVAWALSRTMLIVCVTLVLVFIAATRWLNKYLDRYAGLTTTTGNSLIQAMVESLVGAKLILAYGRGPAMVRNYSDTYQRHANVAVKSQVLASAIPTAYQAFGFFSVSLALYLAIRNGENLATLIAALWTLLRLVPLFSQIIANVTNTSNVLPSFRQYHRLVESAKELSWDAGKVKFEGLRDSIDFRDVAFAYPGRDRAISAVSVSIPKGSFTAFVGESGSGKTTTADILLRLLAPESGELRIDSVSLKDLELHSFLDSVGYVPQESFLFNSSIRDNLLWSVPEASETELWESLRLANIDGFVRSLPQTLDTIVGDRGAALSGGQRQRIALARALLKKPDILILDEATSALDSDSERLIMKSIDAVAPFTTIIVIAHRLSTVARADQVCVFSGGTIVEAGSYAELRDRPKGRLFELIQSQHSGLVA